VRNDALSTSLSARAIDGEWIEAITGIKFHHNSGENWTFQQSYALWLCPLLSRKPVNPRGTFAHLKDNQKGPDAFYCSADSGNLDELDTIGFSHPNGDNWTFQETVHIGCHRR
jgi:hypothetical protein